MSLPTRAIALASMCLWALPAASQPASSQPACAVRGTITSGKQPLPGVAVIVSDEGRDVVATSTMLDGRFTIAVPGTGHYAIRADLPGFAPVTRDVTVDAACDLVLDLALTLQSRAAPLAPRAHREHDAERTAFVGSASHAQTRPDASWISDSRRDC